MEKQQAIKKSAPKEEISGSETVGEKVRKHIPWLFGSLLRKPKVGFPRFKRRRSLTITSKTFGLVIIYVMLFILQTGIVYLVYRKPPALGADSSGNAIFLYPSIHDSFIVEGIVASMLIFIASSGYLMLYQASKYLYNRKMALRILVIGFIMIGVTFILLQYMISQKSGG